jgi:hypothetical protein
MMLKCVRVDVYVEDFTDDQNDTSVILLVDSILASGYPGGIEAEGVSLVDFDIRGVDLD